jgi:FtsP/CotA-like multicopper oxidase with cupredoxin domain
MNQGESSDLGSIPNGTHFDLFNINIIKKESITYSLPDKLSAIKPFNSEELVNEANPRRFIFSMRMMNWTINGLMFDMSETTSNEEVNIDTVEIWEFINGMGGRIGMPHPIHIHGLQFQIKEKKYDNSELWDNLKDGFVDTGWRDTFLLLPGMSVKVTMRFEDFKGLFLYHCHNLEHEDMGMMRNYRVL